jgi:hypothetical protein
LPEPSRGEVRAVFTLDWLRWPLETLAWLRQNREWLFGAAAAVLAAALFNGWSASRRSR